MLVSLSHTHTLSLFLSLSPHPFHITNLAASSLLRFDLAVCPRSLRAATREMAISHSQFTM